MARFAKLPKLPRHMQWWKPENPTTIRVRIEVPEKLRQTIGRRELTRSLDTLSLNEAIRRSHPIIAEFRAQIEAARRVAAVPTRGRYVELSSTLTTVRRPGMPLHLLSGGNARLVTGRHGEDLLVEDLPVDPRPILPAVLVADYNEVVTEWALDKRISPGDTRKTRAMVKRLFDRHDHTDMGRITGPDIVAHKLALVREGCGDKTVENHLTMLRTVFRWAKAHHKITGDEPTAGIPVKAKNRGEGRRVFSNTDRSLIAYHALRSDNPVIKFANLVGLYGGPRLEEIVEADSRDVYLDPDTGIPVLDIRDDYRLKNCPNWKIKNAVSVRKQPLHPAYAEALMAHAASVPPGPLFPSLLPGDRDGKLSDKASGNLNRWLNRIGIVDPKKCYHSHRHTAFSVMVNNGVDSVIAKRATGHTGKDVAEKVYYHGEVPDLYAAIKAIPVPAEYVGASEVGAAVTSRGFAPSVLTFGEAAE
jgi:integrase